MSRTLAFGFVERNRTERSLLPHLRAALRHGRHGRGRAHHEAAPGSRSSAVARLRLPEGDRDGGGSERSRPGHASAAPGGPGRVRAGVVGGGAGRHRGAAATYPGAQRGLVRGQPRRLLVLPRPLGQGLPRRPRLAALLLGRLAGREQPLRRERAALRLATPAPDPRPEAHRVPAHGRRQPAGLARLRAVRSPRARAAAQYRARGSGRPAPHRDGPPVRAPSDPPRHRRIPVAVADRDRVRGGAGRLGLPPALGRRGRRAGAPGACSPARGHRGAHRNPGCTSARAGPRLRGGGGRRSVRPHRLVPRALWHAGGVPARRAERRHRQRRSPWRLGVRPAAGGAGPSWRAAESRPTASGGLASAASRT
jgi:hypothetical protein